MRRFVSGIVAACGLATAASADVRLNELFINPPGTDNGQEFFELAGPAGSSLAGYSLIFIEGDATAAGLIDKIIDLSSYSIGANGLLLWRDAVSTIDTSTAAGVQGPSAGTTVVNVDFNPDIENGTQTYLLVHSFTGSLNQDLDTNNDGVLDLTPWASIADGIALVENDVDSGNTGYASGLGFFQWTSPDFNADAFIRGVNNAWYASDVLGTNPGGPYSLDATRNNSGLGNAGDFVLTPGVANSIPTPGTLALVGLAGLVAGKRRR